MNLKSIIAILALLVAMAAAFVAGYAVTAALLYADTAAVSSNSSDRPAETANSQPSDGSSLAATARDVQRKNDISRTATQLTNYKANNRGALPADYTKFRDAYLLEARNAEFRDPSTNESYVFLKDATSRPTWENQADHGVMFFAPGYECADDNKNMVKSSSRSVAIRIALESGESYCTDS
jgi:hypothetical protein